MDSLLSNSFVDNEADENKMVVGSQARILYSDAVGREKIAQAFNKLYADKKISAPVIISRDHHDVSGTDSPWRETSNIRDGSSLNFLVYFDSKVLISMPIWPCRTLPDYPQEVRPGSHFIMEVVPGGARRSMAALVLFLMERKKQSKR